MLYTSFVSSRRVLVVSLLAWSGACHIAGEDTLPDGGAAVAGEGGAGHGAGNGGSRGPGIVVGGHGGHGGAPPMDAGAVDAGVGPGCGNGIVDPGEACDDGNTESGDGCSGNCLAIEQNFACPVPGELCLSLVECGDGLITGSETCDDRNTLSGDGCDAQCQLEPGWTCPLVGAACQAAACGDGIVAGFEECDDGNILDDDGCSATCLLERGFKCVVPGEPCEPTVCGDGETEGAESCDDGNFDTGDGCSPMCTFEPVCAGGECESRCGDGLKLDDEECDDGNQRDGDGCSSTCEIEPGFTCQEIAEDPVLPIVYRDFVGTNATGSNARRSGDFGPVHRDFEKYNSCREDVHVDLDADGKPEVLNLNSCVESTETFSQWYRSIEGINRTIVGELVLDPVAGQPGTFEFYDTAFFPLNGLTWNDPADQCADPNAPDPNNPAFGLCEQGRTHGHNFHFTSEVRYWFTYRGGERLTFDGDDDVWVFIDRKLAVDIGGVHGAIQRWIQLPDPDGMVAGAPIEGARGGDNATTRVTDPLTLGLATGGIYEVTVFQAERHTTASQYRLTLQNFLSARSQCDWECGDGIVTRFEVCDEGTANNTGEYGRCNPDCLGWGPRCGDGTIQFEHEACDDGLNVTGYRTASSPANACAPGCHLPAYCGDGQVDSMFGEQCDDGVNDGSYNGCTSACLLGPRCGDGILQEAEGEECDDGNTVSGDGCSFNCRDETPILG